MKQFIRNFKKQRIVGLLNISSLSLGIMVAVVIGLWAINELSFDNFHKNKDRIYRSLTHVVVNDAPATLGSTFKPFGESAKEEQPVLEDMCRVYCDNKDMRIDNTLHLFVKTMFADTNFFSFFTFSLKEGEQRHVLAAPDRVVISESAAKKYFPEQNPVGMIIKIDGTDFAVSGIMKDIPGNSSLQADVVLPFYGWRLNDDWGSNDGYITFFLLQKGVKAETLAAPLTQLVHRQFEPFRTLGVTYSLQPLADMHFSPMFMDHIIKGNKPLVFTFILTALVILIISCINFINLFVSTSFLRAKAIGIRKTVGAKKWCLMRDFYWETACYVILSIAAGLVIALAVIPTFNNFTQSNLALDFRSPLLYIFLVALLVFVVLLAGSFPALYMTRVSVIETIKGKFKGKKMSLFQKNLVIAQFAASITLLIVVVFMQKQVGYILAYDLGFNREHVLYVRDESRFGSDVKTLQGEFSPEPSITSVTRKRALPTEWTQGQPIKRIPAGNSLSIVMEICYVSPNYFDFFDMKIIDGENPFLLESSLINDVVINESAARLLGYEHPVGEQIDTDFSPDRRTIRGVVRNAHTKSLHQEVDPQVYVKLGDDRWNQVAFFKTSGDPGRAIAFIEQKWKEREAEYPFEYHFLDDTYKQLYTSEVNAEKVFTFAMLIALIIAVAGLFAMAYYATQRRVREIAIRKVYGATVKDIFILLNKGFVLWLCIAFAIACPVAYYSLRQWLDGFVVKTTLSIHVFLLVGVISLAVALLTTGYQTWKVATANPVDAIKTE